MAAEIEYLNKTPPETCGSSLTESPSDDERASLLEWGITISSLEEMENWYGRVHVGVTAWVPVVERANVTGAELRFNRLRKEWIHGTGKLSILSQIILHPAYQQIIAMGPEAIPLILRSLERKIDHWFWALTILNEGADVAEGAVTLRSAADAWLRWGRENGHLG
jgi:hypothetical protein